MPCSRESSQPRDQTCISYVSCVGRWDFLPLAPPRKLEFFFWLRENQKIALFPGRCSSGFQYPFASSTRGLCVAMAQNLVCLYRIYINSSTRQLFFSSSHRLIPDPRDAAKMRHDPCPQGLTISLQISLCLLCLSGLVSCHGTLNPSTCCSQQSASKRVSWLISYVNCCHIH